MPAFFFVIAIGIGQSLLFLAHWVLYRAIVHFFAPLSPTTIFVLKVVIFLFSLSFILASILSFRSANLSSRIFYIFAASWLGVLWFLLMASFFSWFGEIAMGILHFSFSIKFIAGPLFGLALAASIFGFINAATIRVSRISIKLPNLPEEWRGKTAVWLSDLHLGHVWNYGASENFARIVGGLKPDIVFIGGDFYDGGAVFDLDKLAEPFSQLKPPKGIYFITGNHEEFSDKTPYLEAMKKAGVKVLNNELADINGLQIIGVDYQDVAKKENFKKILDNLGIKPDQPSILLKHAPLDTDIAQAAGISLMLSGHTHRAQIIPFNFITHFIYGGYDFGLKWAKNMAVYTSDGAGTWGPPMRVGTFSEIVFITFE